MRTESLVFQNEMGAVLLKEKGEFYEKIAMRYSNFDLFIFLDNFCISWLFGTCTKAYLLFGTKVCS